MARHIWLKQWLIHIWESPLRAVGADLPWIYCNEEGSLSGKTRWFCRVCQRYVEPPTIRPQQ
jgi:hypothetical protein